MNKSFVILIVCLALAISWGYAQEKTTLKIITPANETHLLKQYDFSHLSPNDTLFRQFRPGQWLKPIWADGYLLAHAASRDSAKQRTVYITFGQRYQWARLDEVNVPESILSKLGFKEKFYINKPFRYHEIAAFFEEVITYSENNGYPFATIGFDHMTIEDNAIQASIAYEQGPLITYDSLVINGTQKVKRAYLASALELTFGKPYNEQKVKQIKKKIEAMPFLAMKEATKLSFHQNQAKIELTLKDNKVNVIDGIIGFLPDDEGELLVTGEFDLALRNLFGRGKSIDVKWQRLEPLSQFLNISYNHPHLFKSPLGFTIDFNILREDTTFINREGRIEAYLSANPTDKISLYMELKSARLLSTTAFEDVDELPDLSDFDITYYGLGYQWDNTNDPITPTKGISLAAEGAAGLKRLRRNAGLEPSLYEGVDFNTTQFKALLTAQSHTKLGKQLVLFNKLSGGIVSNDRLYTNDLFRIGGFKSLRGFPENFFFASEYWLVNTEFRVYYAPQSYLFLFYDQSYVAFELSQSDFEDYPLGLGLGISLKTKSGIVNFAYAVGRSDEQSLSLNLSRIHFGYVANF